LWTKKEKEKKEKKEKKRKKEKKKKRKTMDKHRTTFKTGRGGTDGEE
jgi:hypothetical protein